MMLTCLRQSNGTLATFVRSPGAVREVGTVRSVGAVRARHTLPSTLHRVLPRSLLAVAIPLSANEAASSASSASSVNSSRLALAAALATLATLTTSSLIYNSTQCESPTTNYTQCESPLDLLTPTTEPATGILFPRLINGMTLVGCGVRVKWGFVKVYAVGTYVDPLALSVVKKGGDGEVKKALLDPNYPRTIRIVMNRPLSIEKYTTAILEALQPRIQSQIDSGSASPSDLTSLDEFKNLNPPVDLIQGAEMEMTIRGDTLVYQNAVGQLGQLRNEAFCRALCEVYYGEENVSGSHLESVLKGIREL